MEGRSSADRGQTSSVGNLLMAAIAIVAAGTLGFYAFQVTGQLTGGPPTTELQTTYNQSSQNVTIRVINGEKIDTDHLRIEGGIAPKESGWNEESLTAGESVRYAAAPGDEVTVLWESGNESYIMTTFTVPIPSGWYTVADWNRKTDGDSLAKFKDLYEPVDVQGLVWDEQSNYIRVGQEKKNEPSWGRYELSLPANNGELRLDLEFIAHSFEGSGIEIYAVDANGDRHRLRCDPSDNSFSPATEMNVQCSGNGDSFPWDGTFTVDASQELTKLVIVIDVEHDDQDFHDAGRFYLIQVEVHAPQDG